ncbi:Rpn family recombination-promoting nuclease/putative transposase [Magnetococcales bacterium HHB-1]
MSKIHQPHDKLIKAVLSDPEISATLLRERLPAPFVNLLTSDPPELIDGSFIDPKMRAYFSDRLLKAKTDLGTDAYLYILVEHKSFPDKRVNLQLLRLMTSVIVDLDAQQQGNGLLPPVIPLLICHGSKDWHIEPQFSALFDVDETIKPFLLDFPVFIVNLEKIPNQELSMHPTLRASFMALKYAHSSKEEQLQIIFQIAEDLRETDELFLIKILHYLLAVYVIINEAVLQKMIRIVKPEEEMEWKSEFAQEIKRDFLLTVGPELEERGLQRGLQKGLLEGEAKMLHHFLQRKFGIMPSWVSDRLFSARSEQLKIWFDRALEVDALDEIFQEQKKH